MIRGLHIKRTPLFIACLLLFALTKLAAQTESYSLHTVRAGETLSAIAKANKTTVGAIMRINGMNSKSILKLNDNIKIPITVTPTANRATLNQADTTVAEANKAVNPVPKAVIPPHTNANAVISTTKTMDYKVVKGDNLYKIAKKFNATEAQVMQWNGMKNDRIAPGKVLMIAQTTTSPTLVSSPEKIDTTEAASSKPVKTVPSYTVQPKTDSSASHIIKKDTVKVAPVPNASPTVIVIHDTVYVVKKDTVTINPKPVLDTAATIAKDTVAKVGPTLIPKYEKYVNEEGFFVSYFNRKENMSTNPMTGDAATFKSASGWNDKKFYILINDVPQGTIVRVTLLNKSICAKVIGPLPNIKQDNGLIARLNDAAAAALGTEDAKFTVLVNY